jgi:hypothetical protein
MRDVARLFTSVYTPKDKSNAGGKWSASEAFELNASRARYEAA